MVIFPEVLGEAELAYFDERDLKSLEAVLDDTLAQYIKKYIENPESDKAIVSRVKDVMGGTVEGLTLPSVLRDMGIIQLLSGLSPESLMYADNDLQDIKEKLLFLEKCFYKVRLFVPARTKEAFESFRSTMISVEYKMLMEGKTPTFPNIAHRIDSNKFMFYTSNDNGHTTGVDIINRKLHHWTMCLRGIQFNEYCDSHGINMRKRSQF